MAKFGTAPAWVTITACPAIIAVAVRGWALVVGATVNVTPPGPVPAAGLSDSHARSLLAVHDASPGELATAMP
jgi:hypothetical protein